MKMAVAEEILVGARGRSTVFAAHPGGNGGIKRGGEGIVCERVYFDAGTIYGQLGAAD